MKGQSASPAELTSPAPGSVLPGSSVTFEWTQGTGVSGYWLHIGTTGAGSDNLYSSSESGTSATVSGLPTTGATLYVTLYSLIDEVWQPEDYTFTEDPPVPAALTSPAPGSVLPGSSVTFEWTPGSHVSEYWLRLGTTGAESSNLYSAQVSGGSVTVNGIPITGATIYASLFSKINGVWQPANYTFAEAAPVPAVLVSPTAGIPLPGSPVTFEWTPGLGVSSYWLRLGTTGAGSSNLYSSGEKGTSVTVSGLPTSGVTVYASLFSMIDGAWQQANYAFPTLALSSVSCTTTSFAGAGVDACAVSLNGPAPAGGMSVSLASSSTAVTVPATATVAAGATSAAFTATATAVGTAQSVTITASAGGATANFALQLNAAVPAITLSTSSLSFGSVNLNTASPQSITLTSSGTAALTISSATISGAGFSVSGATFPVTLNPNQTATLQVQFDPTAAGAASGSLSISSNTSSGGTSTVALSGTGMATLSSLTCSGASMTGAGTDNCTVSLNGAAPGGGFAVSLASSSTAVTVPATATVAAGATSAAFTATATAVGTAQSVTITASAGSATANFALQLNVGTPTLGLSASTLAFGNVSVNSPSTESLVLTSSGTAALTISSATITGTGFSVSGATFPMTLNPNQTATLDVEFDPTATGTATGSLTIASNSSSGGTSVVSLSGAGVTVAYQANLTWDAPTTTDPIAGYNVYRAISGSSAYQLLNSSVDAQTSYVDSTVQSGDSYEYYVETVDTSGVSSAPSSVVSLVVP